MESQWASFMTKILDISLLDFTSAHLIEIKWAYLWAAKEVVSKQNKKEKERKILERKEGREDRKIGKEEGTSCMCAWEATSPIDAVSCHLVRIRTLCSSNRRNFQSWALNSNSCEFWVSGSSLGVVWLRNYVEMIY